MEPLKQDNSLFARGGLLEKLKAGSLKEWNQYVDHPFVQSLGNGTLSEECFRYYLIQDYLFLIQLTRAYALAAFKSETLSEIKNSIETCAAILNVEMELHVEFCSRWGIRKSELEKAREDQATLSYTRYVLESGLSGDILDLYVALAPCVLGYAVIGTSLKRKEIHGNPYVAWIEMYAGKEYQEVAQKTAIQIERLSSLRGGEQRLKSLISIFSAATRLESAFWQQSFFVKV